MSECATEKMASEAEIKKEPGEYIDCSESDSEREAKYIGDMCNFLDVQVNETQSSMSTDDHDDTIMPSSSDDVRKKKPRQRRRGYTLEFKKTVVNALTKDYHGNVSATAKAFAIPRTCVQSFVKLFPKIQHIKEEQSASMKFMCRIPVQGEAKIARAWYPEMEKELYRWFLDEKKGMEAVVDSEEWKRKALEIFRMQNEEDAHKEFTASTGWLSRFLERHNLVARAATSVRLSIPDNAESLIHDFLLYFDQLVTEHRITDHRDIWNMDETPMYLDMPDAQSFDLGDVKPVLCKSTGNHRLRFTAVLTISAAGDILPPFIMFRNLAKVPEGNYPKGLVVTVGHDGSMNQEIMDVYRRETWNRRPGILFSPNAILVMDAAATHTPKPVILAFRQYSKASVCLIPAGVNSLVQPLDVCIKKAFKFKLRNIYRKWVDDGVAGFQKSGKRKMVSYEELCGLMMEAVRSVEKEMISMSFVGCGLTINRSENGLHTGLRELLATGVAPASVPDEEHSGLTDDEDDGVYGEDSEEGECDTK